MESYLFKVNKTDCCRWGGSLTVINETMLSAATLLLGRLTRGTIQQVKVTKIYR